MDRRIPVLLSQAACHNSELGNSLERAGEQVVWSWIMRHTYQPENIIARSVLSSSVGFLVTVCVVVSIAASAKNGYITENDGLDWSRIIALTLQWIFILSGWAIVLWRWLTAVAYYPRRIGMKALGLCEYFRVEDFWIRATLELQEEFKERDAESIEKLSFLERYLRKFVHKSRLYKLLSIFLLLQILLIYISQTCWLISEMVFSNRYIRRLLMGSTSEDELFTLCEMGGPENHDDPRVGRPGNTDDGGVEEPGNHDDPGVGRPGNPDDGGVGGPGNPDDGGVGGPENHDDPGVGRPGNTDDGGVGSSSQVPRDFERYSKVLMHMLGENLAAVWIANKKSINDMKAEQQNGGSHGKDCEALISLLLRSRRDLGFMDPFPIS